jgi:hypothetical protein
MKKVMISLIALTFLASVGIVSAQGTGNILSKAADASIALRVYNSATGTLTVAVSTNGDHFVVTIDGNANTMNATTAYDTITELATWIASCTNASGTAPLTVDSKPSLLADSTDDELSDASYTATTGNWLEVLWDTSVALHYDIYIPNRDNQKSRANLDVVNINSVPAGTGDVTASVYIDGTLKWQKIITSPSYYAVDGTTNAWTADNNITVNENINIPVKASQAAIVRVSRATTATTGNISATVK